MTVASVAIQIPQPLYRRLELAAARLQKPADDILVETLQTVLPPADEIPATIKAELAALTALDEASLREIAGSEMETQGQQALDYLLDLQSIQPLTDDEDARLETLRTEYGRILLCKARAFALLAQRGRPLPIE